jgi:hypothetical protein
MQAEGRCRGDYLQWHYSLASPELERLFELSMQCFHARNGALYQTRQRQGELMGGAEGTELRLRALKSLARSGVVDPERFDGAERAGLSQGTR